MGLFVMVFMLLGGLLVGVCCAVSAESVSPLPPLSVTPDFEEPEGERLTVFISDFHMGPGRRQDGRWYPQEDFRWPSALNGFLKEIRELGKDRVDLVVLGDLLELWQPPPGTSCGRPAPGLGCTVSEYEHITRAVSKAHAADLTALGAFAAGGDNRLYIVPGNHDSALVLQSIWGIVREALHAPAGRVKIEGEGVWVSAYGDIVAEHGHQIGLDVNRYSRWPKIVHAQGKKYYVEQSWGENFVQSKFNDVEADFPIIDNLTPESAGLKYRMAQRGSLDSARDVAEFIKFNLVAVSVKQLVKFLGTEDPANPEEIKWDLNHARSMGADLFFHGIKPDDPLSEIVGRQGEEVVRLKTEFDQLASDPERLPDPEVSLLCDRLVLNQSAQSCLRPTLGSRVEKLLIPRRHVIKAHLEGRKMAYRRMNFFIYGHTHEYEDEWRVSTSRGKVKVFNTGAFQRVMKDEHFQELLRRKGKSQVEALTTFTLEDHFAPCYTAVVAEVRNRIREVWLRHWYMQEDGRGNFVAPDSKLCFYAN